MARERHEYDDIPGTYVFDAERSRQGYGINMFCMSLMKDENRRTFKADEARYLDRFPLTQEQRDAIQEWRDYRIADLSPDCRVNREEIFGPVATAAPRWVLPSPPEYLTRPPFNCSGVLVMMLITPDSASAP